MKPRPEWRREEISPEMAALQRVVKNAPPWFIAVILVLGLGALLARLVFHEQPTRRDRAVAVNLKGAFLAGQEDKADNQDEGSRSEQPAPSDIQAKPSPKQMDAPLEPSRWLDGVSRPSPIGPATGSQQPRPGKGGALEPARQGGSGQGQSEKGQGTGTGSPWGTRQGTGRAEGVRRYGGTPGSESAVEKGLEWLARHQASNGAWRADGFESRCRGEGCGGEALKGVNYDAGCTALSLMAYLGAGHTHQKGRYKGVVERGFAFLVLLQDGQGRFGGESMYTQSLAVIALSEGLGMTQDQRFRAPLEKAVAFLMRAQQPKGGWTYDPSPKRQRNDTSITAFAVMAMKSARYAGIEVPDRVFEGVAEHLQRATQDDGDVWYSDAPPGWNRRGMGMVAAGLFASLLLGRPASDPVVVRQVNRLKVLTPTWGMVKDLDQSFMTWYYQNLAFFALGGKAWRDWNGRFRDFLIDHQRRSGCADGSWDPQDLWGTTGGRIYATATHVLNLEIYYKYNPAFLMPGRTFWRQGVAASEPEPRAPDDAPPPVSDKRDDEGETARDRLSRLRDLFKKR